MDVTVWLMIALLAAAVTIAVSVVAIAISRTEFDRPRVGFWLIGGLLATVVGFVVSQFVGTFVFALFIYYSTRPVYRRLRYRIRPSSLAAIGALFMLALPALLLIGYGLAIGIQELESFVEAGNVDLGPLESAISPYVDVTSLVQDPEQLLTANGVGIVGDLLGQATGFLGFFGVAALHLFLMFAVAFYLLRDDHRLTRWFNTRFSDDRGVLQEYLRAVDRDLHHIFFGNILNAFITATIGAISYSLLDLVAPPGLAIPYAALLGLLAGVASLVPIVGMKLVYVPASIYLFAVPLLEGSGELLWFPVAFVVVSFVVVDTIPDLVLRPYVSGRSLHVGMVMIAYIVGPLLFGWYGIFLGPTLLVLIIHFGRIVLPELISGKPIQPYTVDPSYLTGEVPGSVDVLPDVETGGHETVADGDPPPGDATRGNAADGDAADGDGVEQGG